MKCVCCNDNAEFSLLLVEGTHGDTSKKTPRYYLPNQNVREKNNQSEVWFCRNCVRKLEDNFRATLQYLQSENT